MMKKNPIGKTFLLSVILCTVIMLAHGFIQSGWGQSQTFTSGGQNSNSAGRAYSKNTIAVTVCSNYNVVVGVSGSGVISSVQHRKSVKFLKPYAL